MSSLTIDKVSAQSDIVSPPELVIYQNYYVQKLQSVEVIKTLKSDVMLNQYSNQVTKSKY